MYSVFIIGSGNVATALGQLFRQKQINIVGIHSRNAEATNQLAAMLNTQVVKALHQAPAADITLLAVSDNAIESVASQLPENPNTLVIHCSGITPLSVLSLHPHRGVFYPLQSINKNKNVNWDKVPLLVEGASAHDEQMLLHFGKQLGLTVRVLQTEQRQYLHLAAVFANNFTNHMYAIAFDIASKHGIDTKLLQPLIEETAAKIFDLTPHEAQTGPARRRDSATIEKHVELLRQHPQYRQLYEIVSKSIMEAFHAHLK